MTPSTTHPSRRAPRFFRLLGLTALVAATGGVLVGSAPSAYAAAPYNGLPMNGMPLNGIPLNGVPLNGTPLQGALNRCVLGATPRDSATLPPAPVCRLPAGDGAPASPPLPGLESLRHVALADPTLAATPEQRQQLMYLIRCALPEEVVLYADVGAERFTFPGWMGLAPGWLTTAMTPREERWVSACLLAHVNYFGHHVRVSMRATPPPSPAFTADADEQQTYTIFEGGFFGNLFTATPEAYVCRGDRTPAQEADPILQRRICTQATEATTPAGLPLTPCRFVLTGRCAETGSMTVEGQTYTEVIWTYLRPTLPE